VTGGARPSSRTGQRPRSSPDRSAPPQLPGGLAAIARRDVILSIHLAFVALLGVATVILFGTSSDHADSSLPVAIFGLFTLGELIAVLIAIAVAGATGRHSPLAIVDALIGVPLAAIVSLSATPGDGPPSAIPLVAVALLLAGVAGAAAAARVVREQPIERIVLAGALILLAAFTSAVPSAVIVPVLILVVLLWPHTAGVGAERGIEGRSAEGPADRAVAPVIARRGAPDAAAILRARGARPASSSEATKPEAAPPDRAPPGPP
jgi:hypothetical protein